MDKVKEPKSEKLTEQGGQVGDIVRRFVVQKETSGVWYDVMPQWYDEFDAKKHYTVCNEEPGKFRIIERISIEMVLKA